MKTKKLACQGCGADIDPVPGSKFIDCTYCGTTNVLVSDTVQIAPGTAPPQGPPQAPPGAVQVPQVQFQLPTGPSGTEVKKVGKIVGLVVVSVVIAFVGVGVTVFMSFSRSRSEAQSQRPEASSRADEIRRQARQRVKRTKEQFAGHLNRAKRRAGAVVAGARKNKGGDFRIQSDRPLTADVNGDGIADLLVRGSGNLVAALDGTTTAKP